MLDFFYRIPADFADKKDAHSGYDFSSLTDEDIVAAVRTGKGDPDLYTGTDMLYLPSFMGGVKPDDFFQASGFATPEEVAKYGGYGGNNVESVRAVNNQWLILENRNPDINKQAYIGFEDRLMTEFNDKLRDQVPDSINVYFYSIGLDQQSQAETGIADFSLFPTAILLVCTYTFLFLGSFSPLHCKCIVPTVGILCILMSFLAACGIMSLAGVPFGMVNLLIPFVLVGIGVDDMFVICNALDQTDLKQEAAERFHHALGHAGPAITITSLTNVLAFAFGATSSMPGLKKFCGLSSVCIVCLYLSCMTLFVAVVTWDTRRVERKQKECCGGCACKEDTIICCKAKFLSPKQREYSGLEYSAKEKEAMDKEAAKYANDPAVLTVLKASMTERGLGKFFAPVVLHKIGRIVILVIFLVWTGISCYGLSQLEVKFTFDDFLTEDTEAYDYVQADKFYFPAGGSVTDCYLESTEDDPVKWETVENQKKVKIFEDALLKCEGCAK